MSSEQSPLRPRLLVVDDQPANIHILAEALREHYELLVATSGERALALLERRPVDLVLLDVVMPGMDGYEVCLRLKQRPESSDIPVIFVTALNEVHDEERGFEVGGMDYITKPISPPIVRARVRTHLQLKQQRELLERLATIDPLTQLPNRRQFESVLDWEWRRAVRQREPLTLVMVDVDHFKGYNDTYGHPQGDRCLQAVAGALRDAVRRDQDVVARYGGEEFVVVAPATDAAGACRVLENLLRGVRDLRIPQAPGASCGHVTVSAGGATLVPASETSAAELVSAADEMLYEGKASGRDRALHLDLDRKARTLVDGR